MVLLTLSDEQADAVGDILDMWLEEYDDATNDVWKDRSHDTPEEMLEAMDGMREIFNLVTSAKQMMTVRVAG